MSLEKWEHRVFLKEINMEIEEMRRAIRALPNSAMRREALLKLQAFCNRFFPELESEE